MRNVIDITERKRAEAGLQRLASIVESSNDAIISKDAHGTILTWNPAAEQMFGYRAEEVIGQNIALLIPEHDQSQEAAIMEKVLKGDRIQHYETLRLKKDGTLLSVSLTVSPIKDASGTIVGASKIVRDITERKAAQEALRQSEAELQLAQDASNAGTWSWDVASNVSTWDKRYHELYGFEPGEPASLEAWMTRVHPEDRQRLQARIGVLLEPGLDDTWNEEFRAVHPVKGERWMAGLGRVTRDSSGRATRFVGINLDITERKRAETALRQREEELRAMFEVASIAIAQADPRTGQWLRVNPKMCGLTGYSANELLQMRVPDLTYAEDRQRDWEAFQRVVRGEAPGYRLEKRYVRKDGTLVWVNVNMTVIRDAAGQPTRTMATIEDITERKRAVEALGASEVRYRRLFEAAKDGVLILDAETGMVVDVNPFLVQLLGIPREAILTKEIWELGFFKDIVANYDHFKELQEKEYIRYDDKPLETADGRRIDVEFVSNVYEADHQKVVQCNIRDITQRKRAEERLRKLAAAVAQSPVAIVITDRAGNIEFVNPKFTQMTGYPLEEVVGKNPRLLKSGETSAETYRQLWETIAGGNEWRGEFHNKRKDGSLYWETASISPIRDGSGEITHFIAVKEDITEKRRLEANYLRSQRLEGVGALASGIAHDLNNILAPVLMIAPLLRATVPDADSRAMLDTVENCAQRGADIIKQLLTFARGQPGARVPLPLRHLLRDMEKIIRETFPRDITPRVDTAKDLWPLLGDATQLHQALLNLCVNARDAMPDGGTLRLEAKNVTVDETFSAMTPSARPGPHVCVSVTDTGVGIAPENLDRIFDPFFTTKGIGQGTGLGLATALGIVRGHEGFVRVESRLGHGTTFELYFPASPEARAPGTPGLGAPSPRGQGELILVVDDETAVLNSVRRTLERHGYRVVTAAQGAAGLEVFSQHRAEIRAVLTDMMMPVMNGPAMVAALRQMEPRLVILGMTGLPERKGVKGLEKLELSVLLTKPFAGAELLRVLHAALHPPATASPKGVG